MGTQSDEAEHKKKYRQFSRLYIGAILCFLLVLVLFSVTVVHLHSQEKEPVAVTQSPIAKSFVEVSKAAKTNLAKIAVASTPSPDPTPPTPQLAPKPHAQAVSQPAVGIPYVASICTKTVLPYKTKTVSVWKILEISEGGVDGYIQTCTADSNGNKPADITVPAIDKIIYKLKH